jgi:hypothetical protein
VDEAKARAILDDTLTRLGHLPTESGEWAAVLVDPTLRERADYSETPEDDFAGDAVALVLYGRRLRGGEGRGERRRTTTSRIDPLSPPEWWEAESRRRLQEFEVQRFWMRVDAGLFSLPEDAYKGDWRIIYRLAVPRGAVSGEPPYRGLSSAAEVAPLIQEMIHRQHQWFKESVEEPPWGWDPDDLLHWGVEIEFPAESWEQDRRADSSFFIPAGFAAVRSSRAVLDRLHYESKWYAGVLGISQAECLAWALTDVPYTLPWMPVVLRSDWRADWPSVTIQVNSLSATAQSVARAYALSRGSGGGRKAARRAPRPWPALVVAFREQRLKDAPRERWRESFEAFAELYPDHPYSGARTFAEAYRVKSREASQ